MTKQKRLGTKAKVRAYRERERRLVTGTFLALILVVVVFFVYLTQPSSEPSQNQATNPSFELKAAIVDQVSLTFPNETFVQEATRILAQANYSVDYYSGEKITVEFYRNLPTHGYRIIILRVHSALLAGTQQTEAPVGFFTSEPHSYAQYLSEQLADQVFIASFDARESPTYFSIGPNFVTSNTEGKFQNALVIVMGCNGLCNSKMAEAFIEKGAEAYISWNGSVSASHTDQATTQLLQHLVTEGQTIRQAVENTMKEKGPDPDDNSILGYYPLESGKSHLQMIP